MKIIIIFLISYIWGIILVNGIAFIIWLKDPAGFPLDIPTIILAFLFSLAWPVGIVGDFIASNNIFHKLIDTIVAFFPFVLGFYSEKLINKKSFKVSIHRPQKPRR